MKPTLALLLIWAPFVAFSQNNSEILKKSEQLVTEKKYESAFQLLDKTDPKNDDPEIVLAKENIVLAYFVTSIEHQMFALKDLEPNESIEDFRGKQGSYSMHVYPADSIINRLIKLHPDNYKLYFGLGNFYYEAFIHYNANWLKTPEVLFELIEDNYKKGIAIHQGDYMIYYQLGYINELQKKYQQAIDYFKQSVSLNDKYATAHYNLALAYIYAGNPSDGLKDALISIDEYTDKSYKGDAARMTADIYDAMKDTKNRVAYLEMSDKIDPDNYYTLKLLLDVYVKSADPKEKSLLGRFYLLDPANPTIYNDLYNIYSDKLPELIAFYEGKLSEYQKNNKVYGNLNFYLAQAYINTQNKPKARECVQNARQAFATVFPKDSAVFKSLDQIADKTK
jgi:hypothetical protein